MTCARAKPGIKELGLMFTHRCPLQCRHCGIYSSPKNFLSMDRELARHVIEEAAKLSPRPATIVFTGGEPMMYPKRLEELLELSMDLGFRTRVVTSGFWAKNINNGRQLIRRLQLAGLDMLNFSADKFHLEFLAAEVLRNAVRICRETGIPPIVNLVLNKTGDPLEIFCKMYGFARDEVEMLDESRFIVANVEEYEALRSKVQVSYGRLIGLGRAAEYPEEFYLSEADQFGFSPCMEVSYRPVVYPDGDVQACCCAGGKMATFTIGNIKEESLQAIAERMWDRSDFKLIHRFGPKGLFEVMTAYEDRRNLQQRDFASICDLCVAATHGLSSAEIHSRIVAAALAVGLKDLEAPVR